ncbi:MAG: Y-family DNA polymerase [Chitinophagaceae bacterium]
MKAIVDCNSFYCACETVFRPDLDGKPIVVLSNNDGCVIARNDPAKALGIGMAGPYFKEKPIIEKHGVAVFSSNYNLYGDMSRRIMDTLIHLMGDAALVEVYSVDEAFLELSHIPTVLLPTFIEKIRDTVAEWTGIRVSIGVARTKVLSKVANRLAKKNKAATGGILILADAAAEQHALQNTAIEDVWGVGRKYAIKLKSIGITNALQLRQQPLQWAQRQLGGVVGVRLLRELRGEPCIDMKAPLEQKQMIATTRMFGIPVSDVESIRQAVATYTSRVAEKLRRQYACATQLQVFVVPKGDKHPDGRFRHGPTWSAAVTLPQPTNIAHELIRPALQLAEQLFKPGQVYKKAGVMVSGLCSVHQVSNVLFDATPQDAAKTTKTKQLQQLMAVMDNINFSHRNDMVKSAASGTTRNWKMQQNFNSPRYTTRWEEMYVLT